MRFCSAAVIAMLMQALASAQVVAPRLGSSDFRPTPSQPIGWRGDATGIYPDAAGPVHWQRRLDSSLAQVRCQAERPENNADPAGPELHRTATGQWAGHWKITRWLVLAPVAPAADIRDAVDDQVLPAEGTWTPAAGEQLAGRPWKAVSGELIDVGEIAGSAKEGQVAYLASYLYSPVDFEAGLRARRSDDHFKYKVWINGKPASTWEHSHNKFQKGWNSIVFKVASARQYKNWEFWAGLFPFSDDFKYQTEQIAWTTKLPGWGFGMPVIVGRHLYTTAEPNDLVCVDKQSGKIEWLQSHPVWAVLNEQERGQLPNFQELQKKASRLDELNARDPASWSSQEHEEHERTANQLTDDVQKNNAMYRIGQGWGGGNSAATPISDGDSLYVWFGQTGLLACYDLSGKRRYLRFIPPGKGEHGVNSSPVIVGDKLVLLAGHQVIGIERNSGREVWRQHYRHPAYASPVAARVGESSVVVCPNGAVLKADDGTMISDRVGNHDGECASPIVDGDRFFLISRAGFACVNLPKEPQPAGKPDIRYSIEPMGLDPDGEIYCVGSPLYYQGLVYAIRSGWGGGQHTPTLFVIEADTGQVVYRQALDFEVALFYDPKGGGAVASVTMAGQHLYVMDNRGTTIVFKPGRHFQQEAKNTIQHLYTRENVQEVTNSTPIFEGRRMYYRGLQNLYCIEN